MKNIDDITVQIRSWVIETFPLAKQREIGIHDSLLDSGIIDSLGTLEVVQYLEEEFDIEVTDEEMVADHFESVSAIAQLLESKTRDLSGDAKAS